MSDLPSAGKTLVDYVPGNKTLKEVHLREAAAFGQLVDWQVVKFLLDLGYELVRQSYTFKEDEVLMVMKMRKDGLPYVVFTSKQDPMGCMRTFLRRMSEGTANVYPDKYG